jgi:hypothetical protein
MSPFKLMTLSLALVLSCHAEQSRFISVTPENAVLLDGTKLINAEGETFWKWLPDEGNGGLLESVAHESGGNAPPLRVEIEGLSPKSDYEVFGYFWAPGYPIENKEKFPNAWPVRFGFGIASMATYGGREFKSVPWIVYTGAKIGAFKGILTTQEEKKPIGLTGNDFSLEKAGVKLIRGRIGIARTDAKGSLAVYVDDFPDSIHCDGTRIDGIALQPAPKDAKPIAGAGDSRVLHHALRANDWQSAKRELDAGADVNALDSKSFSTMYQPASCGDVETVERLLKAGANPNQPGQIITVLAAAASTGNADMVRLLLKAGAEVSASPIEMASWMETSPNKLGWVDQALLHPAIVAIRVGSLDTLKALLEKQPDLDLEALGGGVLASGRDTEKSIVKFLVEDAMREGHDELAAFLVDRGCSLCTRHFLEGSNAVEPRPYVLLARSITSGEELIKTRKALLKRGVSPVRKLGPPHHSNGWHYYGVEPWDGLTAAVFAGNLELTQQFLLHADWLPLYYEESLLALARWHGEPRILNLLKQKFPDASKADYKVSSSTVAMGSDEALRQLMPRIKADQSIQSPDDGIWTLAVLASPKAGGQGAFLEVEASKSKHFKVVDRQEVEKALLESEIADPWGGGDYHFAELGDRVSADLLVLVSLIESPEIKLLRFEVVDVATGLAVMREHVEQKAFDPQKSTGPLLQRIRSAIAKSRSGDRPKAITLLPFSVDKKVFNSGSLKGILRATVQAEVDASAGLLSVSMQEINAIAGEQALKGEGAFWSAAYTLEGGVSALENGKISLTLRMRFLKNPGARAVDQTEEGMPFELPKLAQRAWKKMISSGKLGINMPDKSAAPNPKQASAEAKRLLREAEWLLASKMNAEAMPLLERANLLGAKPETLVKLHLEALISQLPIYRKSRGDKDLGVRITSYPLNLRHQQQLMDSLAPAQEMLDQMSYYQARYGKQAVNWKTISFLPAVEILCFIRSAIPEVLPDASTRDAAQHFGTSLDEFTAEYFRVQCRAKEPKMYTSAWRSISINTAILERNPELLKGWVDLFMVSSAGIKTRRLYSIGSFNILMNRGDPRECGVGLLLLEQVAKRMDQVDPSRRPLRQAEMKYARSTGDGRVAAAKILTAELSKIGRRGWGRVPSWVAVEPLLKRYGMSELTRGHAFPNPMHGDTMLAALVHEPTGSTDWISRGGYDWTIRRRIEWEELSFGEFKKRMVQDRTWDRYAGLVDNASAAAQSRKEIEEIIEGVGLWQQIYGWLIYTKFKQHCERMYPSLGDEAPTKGLRASLLVDLRQLDNSMPGMFYFPTVDKNDKGRMWLYYQPYEKEPIFNGHTQPLRRYPWLAGVDCNSGEINVKANLIEAPGLDPGAAHKNATGRLDHFDGFIAQTDDMLLTSVDWPGMNYEAARVRDTGVLIRKSNGELVGLKKQTTIRELANLATGTTGAYGAVPVGDVFIAAKAAGDRHSYHGRAREEPHELVQISSDGSVVPITVHGRRPQISPFDPIDRTPKMMMPRGNNVLVISDWEHAARYSPKSGSWQPIEGKADQTKKNTKMQVNKDYRHFIFSCHKIPRSNGAPELIVQWDDTWPDKIAVHKPGTGAIRLDLDLEIPDGFAQMPVYPDWISGEEKLKGLAAFGSYEKRKGTKTYRVAVLHKTQTHLILAMKNGGGFSWTPGRRAGEYLPLLWSLPIKDLQDAVMSKK